MSKCTFFAENSTSRKNGNLVSFIFSNDDTAELIARWYSRLPKFVCGTIKPMLKCCCVFSSSFLVWCSCLCLSLSPPIRFGPRSPIVMPDDPDDVCDRHAKVVTIIDTKTNKMYDVFIITPSPWMYILNALQSFAIGLRKKCRNDSQNFTTFFTLMKHFRFLLHFFSIWINYWN